MTCNGMAVFDETEFSWSFGQRCAAVFAERRFVEARKTPQRILCGFPRGFPQHRRIAARENRLGVRLPSAQTKKTSIAACLIAVSSSDGALNLVGTETSCTDVYMARSTVDNRLHALDIGLPHSVGPSVGMGDLDAERNALAADIALCHWMHLQSIGEMMP